MLALLFALLASICPQEKIAANLSYLAPAVKGQPAICRVHIAATDPITGETLAAQDAELTSTPQQVLLEPSDQIQGCRLVRLVIEKVEGCSNPGGLRESSMEFLDALTGKPRGIVTLLK